MKVLSHQSARLSEVPKLGAAKIRQIRESWRQNETMRENMIFGQTYGISVAKMTKIVRRYGPDAIAVVKANPYRLCRDIWGIGFSTADKIALSVGIPHDSPMRARATIAYALEAEAEDWPLVVHDCSDMTKFARDLNLCAKEGGWFGRTTYGMEFEVFPFAAFIPALEDADLPFVAEEELPPGFRAGDIVI